MMPLFHYYCPSVSPGEFSLSGIFHILELLIQELPLLLQLLQHLLILSLQLLQMLVRLLL